MFKFLLYFVAFYFIIRYLFGGLFKVKVYNFNQHTHYNQPEEQKSQEEGKITIDPRVQSKPKKHENKLGEYVDFEEVKQND